MLVRILLAASLLCLSVSALAQDGAVDAFRRETLEVRPGVWLIYKPDVTDPPFEGNVVVIEQESRLVVVDAGGSGVSGQHVVEAIRELSDKPVGYLIYTHFHGDHNLGAGMLRAAWPGLVIVSTEATRRNMTGPAMDYVATYAESYAGLAEYAASQADDESLPASLRAGWRRTIAASPSIAEAYAGLRVTPADLTFSDTLIIADALAPVEVHFLGRANTDGDALIWAPQQQVLVTGDIVVAPIPYAAHTYPSDWIETLTVLKSYPARWIIPGHGPVQADTGHIETLIEIITLIREQVAQAVGEGVGRAELGEHVDIAAITDRLAGDDAWLRYVTAVVFTGGIITNAWKEAEGIDIVQGVND